MIKLWRSFVDRHFHWRRRQLTGNGAWLISLTSCVGPDVKRPMAIWRALHQTPKQQLSHTRDKTTQKYQLIPKIISPARFPKARKTYSGCFKDNMYTSICPFKYWLFFENKRRMCPILITFAPMFALWHVSRCCQGLISNPADNFWCLFELL